MIKQDEYAVYCYCSCSVAGHWAGGLFSCAEENFLGPAAIPNPMDLPYFPFGAGLHIRTFLVVTEAGIERYAAQEIPGTK